MLRKQCIRLSIATKSALTPYLEMSLAELAETIEDVQAVLKENE